MSEIKIKIVDHRTNHETSLELPSDAWPLVLGRDSDCTIRIDEDPIAAKHAKIERYGRHNMVTMLAEPTATVQGQSVPIGSLHVSTWKCCGSPTGGLRSTTEFYQ